MNYTFPNKKTLTEVFYNVNYSVKSTNVDCKYLLFLQDFSSDQNQNSTKNANIADYFKKTSGNS